MKEDNIGIYSILNKKNLKRYIGMSNDLYSRISHHKGQLREGKHYNTYLQRAWNKYGEENFVFEILEICDEKSLPALEIDYISKYKSFEKDKGYNLTKGGEGTYGRILSEETLLKISKSLKGKTLGRKAGSEELKNKSISRLGSKNPMFGISPSLETRKKISQALSGENHYGYGKHRSDETKAKLSKSLTGKIQSEETKRKISEANSGENNFFYGKVHTEESRKKISEAGRNRKPISDETRKKMSDSHKRIREEKRKGGNDGLDSL